MVFNKENIANYLHNDAALMNADASNLRSIVEENPYSGILQLVYCKYLHLHNDIKLEQQLEKCALVVSDRKKIYEILFQKKLQKQITEHESAISEVKETPLPVAEKDVENTIETNKVDSKNNTPEDFNELEQNIINEAINSSIQIDINDYLKEEENDTEEVEKKEVTRKEVTEEEQERTFINWFDKPTYKKESQSKPSIINNFLSDSKNKEKISSSIVSPSEMAKMSLVANTQFVTGTLATIYAKQGQIAKAIEIYEQLSLKNPEKKTFFASRIRFLKEKQQYNK